MRKTIVFLGIILFLGFFLRFYRLGDVPFGLHRDEAFLGYNAYSILKTGKDISGIFLPLHLKSFLYSPTGYSYFSIPFIKIFDLSAFSVRFASAFFGSLTILITYFLVCKLFTKSETESGKLNKEVESKKKNPIYHFSNPASSIALLTSSLLAISPWHINLSRTATENTIVVFFIVLGIFLYLYWAFKKKWYLLLLAFITFGTTLLIYQAPRAFLPIFIPLMVLFFLPRRLDKNKLILISGLFIIVILIPIISILLSQDISLRIRTVSIFSTNQTQLILDEQIRGDGVTNSPVHISKTYHNKLVGYSSFFLQNYFKHFSYDFLFTDQGFPDRYRVPLVGLIYIFELPFLILGIWFLFINHKRVGLFLLGWVLLAPVGSALTFDDVPNLQRTLIIFPALSIIAAFGLFNSYLKLKDFFYTSKILAVLIIILIFYSLFFYLHQYYIHLNMYRPWHRQDGYKELVVKINSYIPSYKKAVITNHESAPSIFFLFYGKFNPQNFQKETKNTKIKDFDRINFYKYEFSEEQCPIRLINNNNNLVVTGEKETIYVNSGLCQVPNGVKILSKVRRGDGSLAFYILSL